MGLTPLAPSHLSLSFHPKPHWRETSKCGVQSLGSMKGHSKGVGMAPECHSPWPLQHTAYSIFAGGWMAALFGTSLFGYWQVGDSLVSVTRAALVAGGLGLCHVFTFAIPFSDSGQPEPSVNLHRVLYSTCP